MMDAGASPRGRSRSAEAGSLYTASERTGGDRMLTADERKFIRQNLEADPEVSAALWDVGAAFNDNDVLEYTCTEKTQQALERVLPKLKWLERPDDLPRYTSSGKDAKGIDTIRVCSDSTTRAETGFGEVEKVFLSSNGTWKPRVWHGLVLEKFGRMNQNALSKRPGGSALGHHDMQAARGHNAILELHGRGPQHPGVRRLAPRSRKWLQGVDFYDWIQPQLEAARAAPAPSPAAPAPAAPAPAAPVSAAVAPVPPRFDPLNWAQNFCRKPDSRPPAAPKPAQPRARAPAQPLSCVISGAALAKNLPGYTDSMVLYDRGVEVRAICALRAEEGHTLTARPSRPWQFQTNWDLGHKPLCTCSFATDKGFKSQKSQVNPAATRPYGKPGKHGGMTHEHPCEHRIIADAAKLKKKMVKGQSKACGQKRGLFD